MAIILAFCNKKGGCGKTAAAINVAAGLAAELKQGKRVLLIDADGQGNSSSNLGCKITGKKLNKTLYEALTKDRLLDDVVITTEFENLDVLVGDSQLDKINMEMTIDPGAPTLLKDLLESSDISNYEYIVIDTNPAINLMFYNALNAAHYFVLPIFPEADSFDGVAMMFEVIARIQKKSNKMLDFLGMIVTRNKDKSGTHKNFMKKIREFGEKNNIPILATIPDSDAVAAASANKKPLIYYRADLPVSEAYSTLSRFLLKALKPRRGRPTTLDIPSREFEELATHEFKHNEVEIDFE